MSDDMDRGRRDEAKAAIKDAGKTVKKAMRSSRDSVKDGLRSTRRRAHDAREGAVEGFENNPLVALAGGLALGGVIGALLPRSRRETELLASLGKALNDAGARAATAAREAGTQKLDELGISKSGAKDSVNSLIGAGREAAKSAGKAAGAALKESRKSDDDRPVEPIESAAATGGATVLGDDDDDTANFYEGDVAEGRRDQ